MAGLIKWMKIFKEKLWFRPLLVCIFSALAALLAKVADGTGWHKLLPDVNRAAVEELLTTLSSSMLVIAVFAVGSMITAFNAASTAATPRSFKLIIADDVSQNALSVFVGAFIYSIVSLVALKSEYYGSTGLFILFALTALAFVLVILTFLRWVDRISRLGRMGHTIQNIEEATKKAIDYWKKNPHLGGQAFDGEPDEGIAVYSSEIGYVQQINMSELQQIAEKNNCKIVLRIVPGKFVTQQQPLLWVKGLATMAESDENALRQAVVVAHERSFDYDIRFGIIALSEIASRALSPAVNDPGTAIAIIGSHTRLFHLLGENETATPIRYQSVHVPDIALESLFTDAFRPIARDGASFVEVQCRLQKALWSIAASGKSDLKQLACTQSKNALERAKAALSFGPDFDQLEQVVNRCSQYST